MGADKNSLQRELGLCPEITSKCPPHVLSRSRSNHCATDPRNNLSTRTPWGGQTGIQGRLDRLGSDHPYTTRQVTRPQHTESPVQK